MSKAKKPKKHAKRTAKMIAVRRKRFRFWQKKKEKAIVGKTLSLDVNPPGEIQLKKTKIRVFGIGGGASSIISEIAPRVKKASFVAVDTDRKALGEVNKGVIRFQFGENLTHGFGTGMKVETGKMAALAEKNRIKKLFEGQDLCIFVVCLGGGTGSGATSVFAKVAKNSGCLAFGIFTLPFNFEGEKKTIIARESLSELKQKLHAFTVIPNERIFQIIQKETPLRAALSAINNKLSMSLEGLIEVIYEPGLINIDFADLKAILGGQGKLTYLNTVEVRKKEGAVQEEINMLLNSPLYPYGIRGAKGVLYNIAGEKGLSLAEVGQISKNISDLVNKEARIIFGISQNQKYGKNIKTTLLAAGCGTKIFVEKGPGNALKEKKSKAVARKRKTPKKSRKGAQKNRALKKESRPSRKRKKQKPERRMPGKKKLGGKKRKSSINHKGRKIRVSVISQDVEQKSPETTASLPREEKINPPLEAHNTHAQAKIRKNALQIKAEADHEEEEMLARERVWETPAFLRRKK